MTIVWVGFKWVSVMPRGKLLLLARLPLVAGVDFLTDFIQANTALDQCFAQNLQVQPISCGSRACPR